MVIKILTAKEMAFADENTINLTKIPSLVLMENAGRSAFEVINNVFKDKETFIIAAGSGNNGGDGIVIARYLLKAGKKVKVFLFTDSKQKLSKDNLHNLEIYETFGGEASFITEPKINKFKNAVKEADVVIDALFGTGFKPPVKGYREKAIKIINKFARNIVCVDIPSGLSADSGNIYGEFVKANLTITFAYPKKCHVLYPASEFCGDVYVVDISIDENYLKEIKRFLITSDILQLPKREKNSHKYTYGHNLVIGGSTGKSGAVIMASKASTKTGAGLTTAVVPESINHVIEANLIEEMSIPVDDENGGFGKKAYRQIKNIINHGKFSSITIGMGMGVSEYAKRVLEVAINSKLPLVVDADGLNNLAKIENFKSLLKKRKHPTVLTPHIGEMSRLTGLDKKFISENMEEVARDFSLETGCITVLKSSRVVIATPSEDIYYSIRGNEAMATAGTGDVLAGILGALINRLSPIETVKLGVYLHGLSGELASDKYGVESVKATDLIDFIPEAYRKIKEKQKSLHKKLVYKIDDL